MTKSLRFRLFLTYAAITLIILTTAALTLTLAWRGVQNRVTQARLSASIPLTTRLVRELLRQGTPPQEIADQVARAFDARHARLLLVQKGQVVGDTAGQMTGRPLTQDFKLPKIRHPAAQKPVTGRFTGPDGRRYLYAMMAVRPPKGAANRKQILVFQVAPQHFLGINEDLSKPLGLAVVAALLVGLAFSWLISRWITRPLTAIARAADEIGQGNLDFQLQVSGPAEIEHVARQFNNMAAEVRASRQAQQAFIANVSHDLKTPLTSILGFSQALVEGVASDKAGVQRAAGIIYAEAQRMSRLVEQLLDLAKLEAGRVQLQRSAVNLTELVQEVARRFAPLAEEKGVNLTASGDEAVWVSGDADRLMQALTNLLDNALRYTPNNGAVSLHVGPQADAPDYAEVTVRDTGPGIAPEDAERVFDRFYQADKARKRGSAGLGLAIVQEIVRAHGGQVGVYAARGQGATFWIRLPRKQTP